MGGVNRESQVKKFKQTRHSQAVPGKDGTWPLAAFLADEPRISPLLYVCRHACMYVCMYVHALPYPPTRTTPGRLFSLVLQRTLEGLPDVHFLQTHFWRYTPSVKANLYLIVILLCGCYLVLHLDVACKDGHSSDNIVAVKTQDHVFVPVFSARVSRTYGTELQRLAGCVVSSSNGHVDDGAINDSAWRLGTS